MSPCQRFESEGLLLLEQDAPLDPHFDQCPDCVAARRAYERLRADLSGLSQGVPAPPGWQARVWKTIDRGPTRPDVWAWMAPAAALAAGLAVIAFVLSRLLAPSPTPRVAFSIGIEAGGRTYRGDERAQPGDVLVLRAHVGGSSHAALRVYQDDRRLVLDCENVAPCRREGDELHARVTLGTTGAYQPVLLISDAPLPAPAGALDADAGAARRRGARFELGERVVVR